MYLNSSLSRKTVQKSPTSPLVYTSANIEFYKTPNQVVKRKICDMSHVTYEAVEAVDEEDEQHSLLLQSEPPSLRLL